MSSTARRVFFSLLGVLLVTSLVTSCSRLYMPDEVGFPGLRRAVMGLEWRAMITPRDDFFMDYYPEEGGWPTVVPERGVVLVGSRDGHLYCLDTINGRVLWEHEVAGKVDSQPTVDRRRVYFGTSNGELVALDLDSGEQLWTYATRGEISSHPVVTGDLVVFTTNANELYALDKRSGEWRWHYKKDPPTKMTIRGFASPVVANGQVLVGFTTGHLTALDLENGSLLWEKFLADAQSEFRDVDTTPQVRDGRVYVASYSGGVYCLSFADGKVLWRNAEQVATVGLVLVRGLVWTTSARDGLQALRATDGDVVYRTRPLHWGRPGPPVAYRNLVLVNTFEGPLYVFQNHSGELLQAFATGHGFAAPPAVGRKQVFALSNGGYLYGFRIGGLGFLDVGLGERATRIEAMSPSILEQYVEPRSTR